MPRHWDEKYQFKYNKCISISRNDACSRSERPRSGLKKYKVNDHGIIICKYLESDEIDRESMAFFTSRNGVKKDYYTYSYKARFWDILHKGK